jgi:hypothetical protein
MSMKTKAYVAVGTTLAFVFAVVWPRGAQAQTSPPDDTLGQARAHFEAGKNAYNAGDFLGAIREFKTAESLRPSPILDYNIGLSNEQLNRPRAAVRFYRRYLEAEPNAQNAVEVRGRIAGLEQRIASQPPPPPPAAGAPPTAVEEEGAAPLAPGGQAYQASYDPYGQPAPVVSAPPKKKSYWWVYLIIFGGAGLLTLTILAYAVSSSQSTYYPYAVKTNLSPQSADGVLFRF